MVDFTISTNNIHIIDSAFVEKKDFERILEHIKFESNIKNEHTLVFNRTMGSLKREWAVHNFLYEIHIKRDRTKDVDLDYPQSFIMSTLYNIGGVLVWLFIK